MPSVKITRVSSIFTVTFVPNPAVLLHVTFQLGNRSNYHRSYCGIPAVPVIVSVTL